MPKSKIRLKKPLDFKGRQEMAKALACTVQGFYQDGIPYKSNSDDYYWTINDGNDWKVKFFEDNESLFEIIHRYDNKQAVHHLVSWLSFSIAGAVAE